MPIVFVHGITVREARFEELLQKVTVGMGLGKGAPKLRTHGYYWGDRASSLALKGASIPGFIKGGRNLELGREPPPGSPASLLALLIEEPCLELIALKDPGDNFDPSGASLFSLPPSVEVRNKNLWDRRARVADALHTDEALRAAIGGEISAGDASRIVTETFTHAGRADRNLRDSDVLEPVARAIAASLYIATQSEQSPFDAGFRWEEAHERVCELLAVAVLGTGGRSLIGDLIKAPLLELGTAALQHGLRRRLMAATSIFLGDVFVYLAHKKSILAGLEAKISAACAADPGPIWLVGHSLGGIVSYDYLVESGRVVERLITVGSQVGLFGELGALSQGSPIAEKRLTPPGSIGRWLNIFDESDMLSFLAVPVFERVTDHKVDNKAPFPSSHSEYWNRKEVYDCCVSA